MNGLVKILNHDGTLVVSSRQVAENFEKNHRDVLASIDDLIKGVAENSADLFIPSEYIHEQNKQTYREYLITKDGFSLLVMGFTGQKALDWKLKYIQAFNQMEKQLTVNYSNLTPELQMFKQLFDSVVAQSQICNKALETSQQALDKVESIKNVITLNPNSWRTECNEMINKIAYAMGGTEHMKDNLKLIKENIYETLNKRFAVDLEARLRNRRRRMAEEGICKTKRDKLNYLDIISEDKKLIEGYILLVKELAIKNGVS